MWDEWIIPVKLWMWTSLSVYDLSGVFSVGKPGMWKHGLWDALHPWVCPFHRGQLVDRSGIPKYGQHRPPPHRAVIPQWGQVRPSNHRAGGRENARSMTAAWWPKWSKGDVFKEAFWFGTQFLWKRRGKIGNYKTEASRYCFNRGVAPCRMKSWPRAPQAASTAGSKRETVNRVCVVPATTTHVVICWAFWNHTYWEPTLCSQGRAEWPRLCLQGPGWNRATNPSSRTSQLHERK